MNKLLRVSMMLVLATAMLAGFGCTKGEVGTKGAGDKPAQVDSSITSIEEAATAISTAPIYFAYDRYDLDNAAKNDLKVKAGLLIKFPQLKVQIAGHCDERGTEEYNLALGERRARAAYDYLVLLGVRPAQLSTHSYGKMYPAVQGSTEAAWSKNRRDEFRVVR